MLQHGVSQRLNEFARTHEFHVVVVTYPIPHADRPLQQRIPKLSSVTESIGSYVFPFGTISAAGNAVEQSDLACMR